GQAGLAEQRRVTGGGVDGVEGLVAGPTQLVVRHRAVIAERAVGVGGAHVRENLRRVVEAGDAQRVLAAAAAIAAAVLADGNGLTYPAGPYGYTKHAVIANLNFLVKEDPLLSAGDANYAGLDPVQRTLADYFNDTSVSWLVLTGAAGWCGPCREEAQTVPADS